MPGSNGDGRGDVDDPVWQAFAKKQRLALLGVRLTDKPHDQPVNEQYANASEGSGQALLDALAAFATKSHRAELAAAPLLLWGMSAGGEFNYEFVAWRPERVIGFIVNKGGIYFTALTSPAARRVPGLLFIGGKDLDSSKDTIRGLFAPESPRRCPLGPRGRAVGRPRRRPLEGDGDHFLCRDSAGAVGGAGAAGG